jgi:hypothetical protein
MTGISSWKAGCMKDSLAIYLHDHLAGADFAIDLLHAMKERQIKNPGSYFVGPLLNDIEEDRDTLQQLTDTIGSGSNVFKEATAWLSEKASRMKLGADAAGDFGEFEALEFLALGILGKLSLWQALQVAAPSDARLGNLDFQRLIGRAEEQHAEVEGQRLLLAATALRTSA